MSKTTLARFGESIARHYNGIRTAAGLRTLLPRRWQSEESRLTARQPKVESFVRVIAPFALAFGVIHARPAEPPIVGAAKPAQEVQIAQAGPHAPALSGPSGSQDARPEARRPAQVQPAAVSQARRQSLSNRGAYTAPADRRKMAYHAIIEQVAAEEGVDPALVRAVVQAESEYNPRSHSHVGAIGLMQLMPATARGLGVDDPWDPEQNIRGGTRFLRELLDQFSDERLAVAAYNAGPGAVRRFGGIPPYRETQRYVPKVMAWRDRFAADPMANLVQN